MRHYWIGTAVAVTLATGCRHDQPGVPSLRQTRQQIGRWTYDDAVAVLGTPVASRELGDHSRVADWVVARRVYPRIAFGLADPRPGSQAAGETIVPEQEAPILRRLEFDGAGRLVQAFEVRQ